MTVGGSLQLLLVAGLGSVAVLQSWTSHSAVSEGPRAPFEPQELPGLRLWSRGPWRELVPGESSVAELKEIAERIVETRVRGWLEEARARAAVKQGDLRQFAVYDGVSRVCWTLTFWLGSEGIVDYVKFAPRSTIEPDFRALGLTERLITVEGGSFTVWTSGGGVEYVTSQGGRYDPPAGALAEILYVVR